MRVFKQLFLFFLCVCLILSFCPSSAYATEDSGYEDGLAGAADNNADDSDDSGGADSSADTDSSGDNNDSDAGDGDDATGAFDDEKPGAPSASLSALLGTAPEIMAETGVLIDADTGMVLYDKKMNERMYPASMTKVISAIVAINHASLTDKVTLSDNAIESLGWDAMTIGINAGDTLTMKDALLAMLLPSANECANGVAEFVGGSLPKFADMMNEWAASVGALNSHFVTPSGLFDEDHYTTAYDMAIMARAAIQNQTFLELETYTEYTLSVTDAAGSTRELPVTARHQMAGTAGFVAGKTGYEDLAGHTLVTVLEREGTTLIAVVMNSDDYYVDTTALMDYGFSTFEHSTAADVAPALFSAQSDKGFYSIFGSDYYPISVAGDSALIAIKGMDPSLVATEASYQTEGAPVTAENAVGYITFSYETFILGYAPIIKKEVTASVIPEPETSSTKEDDQDSIISKIRRLPTVVKVFCVILLIVLVFLLICVLGYLVLLLRAQYIRYQREKRRRQRRERQRRQHREQLESRRVLRDDGSDDLNF